MKLNFSENKTIALNTLIIYFRLFIVSFIGLLTSRYVLQLLGISDYGLYNVVGGVIALFSFFSASLSVTTVRFLNYELGKEDGDTNRIFNICNVTHMAFAAVLLVIAETLGIYYINNYLNVEAGKEADAMFVYQVSTIVACVGIINVPYSSIFTAMEKFLFIAIVDIGNSVLKLGLILFLFKFSGNLLRAYAIVMSATTFTSFVVYHYFSYKFWPKIIKWNLVTTFKAYKPVISFNNYNILSSVAMLARSQGSNILINWFFGTAINGAYAIAKTVQGFVESFSVNFDIAAAPNITKHISAGEQHSSQNIACVVCRFCILMMILVFFPLMCETEFILSIWLGQVPEKATFFCQILLVLVLVSSTSGGILQYINGSGHIKLFKLQSCFWYIIVLPIGYFMFKQGYGPQWILILFILSDIGNRIIQLILMHQLLGFDSKKFIHESYIRPAIIVTIMYIVLLIYWNLKITSPAMHIVGICAILVLTAILIFFIGLKCSERSKICNLILQYFSKI